MNDDTNVEPVDLSPTRAELIARVRARGRQIRARRRLAITGLTALVVLAIAAPAIAIGTHSSSHGVTPATVVHHNGMFRIAPVLQQSAPPCAPGTLPYNPPVALTQHPESVCLRVGPEIMNAADVRDASVVHQDTSWVVEITVEPAALHRLAAIAPGQAAVIVNSTVISAPVVQPGITGTTFDIAPDGPTRAQAIALATEILGRPPAHVAVAPSVSATIELPGTTFVAGSVVHATLVIDNSTDHNLTLEPSGSCHAKWEVSLTNAALPLSVAFTSECGSQRTVLVPGANRFAITVGTTYPNCIEPGGVGLPGDVHCLPDLSIPPLPPGEYQAVLSTSPGGLFAAPPVPVHLTAPGSPKP